MAQAIDDGLDEFDELDDSLEGVDDFEDDFGEDFGDDFEDSTGDFEDDAGDFDDLSESSESVDELGDDFYSEAPDAEFEEAPEEEKKKKRFWLSGVIAALVGSSLGLGALWWVLSYRPADLQYLSELTDLFPSSETSESLSPDDEFVEVLPEPPLFSESLAPEEGGEGQESEATPAEPETIIAPPETVAPPVVKKPVKKMRYFVEVARCIDKECVEDYQFLLKRYGIRASVVSIVETTPAFEVISQRTFQDRQATQWVREVNHRHQWSGQAFRKASKDQFLISLGLFPQKEKALHTQNSLNQTFRGELGFQVQKTQQKTRYHQIRTRQFNSKDRALDLHQRLVLKDERFFEARIGTRS